MRPTLTPQFVRSPHLVDLIADAERIAARIATGDAAARAQLAAEQAPRAAVASLRLDGSPLEEPPDPADLAELTDLADRPHLDADVDGRTGTWFDALRAFEDDDAVLHGLEYLGVRAALAADDLAEPLLTDPLATLVELHRRLTRGLVHPDRAGRPRQVEQAVHDASVGRILYFTSDPDAVPGELAAATTWLASTGAREHGLIASGVLHLDLLRIHPFDAANGRLARAAARLVLRARGLDPDGLAAPELELAGDAIGYYEEVARTLRRRDLTIWLERWGEAVAGGLRAAARALGVLSTPVPDRAGRFLAARSDPAFTVADYRADAAVGPEDARADLHALLDAGAVERVAGSRGLRYRVVTG